MSLLTEQMTDCVKFNKITQSDGYGAYWTEWQEGARFKAAISFEDSIEAKIAEKQGVTSLYTVTVDKAMMLDYHDAFKRVEDGKVFRVTSDGDDKFTPDSSSLDMRVVTAEEWSLPNG